MQSLSLAGAGLVLLLSVSVGIVAHELSHAAVLYVVGIQCDIDIGLSWIGLGQSNIRTDGTWAAVTPREISSETSAWALRLSSVAPLVLAVPFLTVATGTLPDPVQADSLLFTAWAVGWLACAIPSPQDFSVFWYAEQAVTEYTVGSVEE